jgi:hypothetical protein
MEQAAKKSTEFRRCPIYSYFRLPRHSIIDEFEQLNMLGFVPQPNLQKSYIPPFPHREGG